MPQIHQNPLLINHKCPSEQEMSAFVFYLIAILAIFHTFCPLFFTMSTRNENFSRPAAQGRQHKDSQGFTGINLEWQGFTGLFPNFPHFTDFWKLILWKVLKFKNFLVKKFCLGPRINLWKFCQHRTTFRTFLETVLNKNNKNKNNIDHSKTCRQSHW